MHCSCLGHFLGEEDRLHGQRHFSLDLHGLHKVGSWRQGLAVWDHDSRREKWSPLSLVVRYIIEWVIFLGKKRLEMYTKPPPKQCTNKLAYQGTWPVCHPQCKDNIIGLLSLLYLSSLPWFVTSEFYPKESSVRMWRFQMKLPSINEWLGNSELLASGHTGLIVSLLQALVSSTER